jgi:flagellar basal-body rod protein FlgB
MLPDMFQSTTIPMLAEVVDFAQARHAVLAGNIANMTTPGYQARDLSVEDFQAQLKEALSEGTPSASRSSGDVEANKSRLAGVARSPQALLKHDMGNVDMETQVSEMVKNQMQHNLALTIMVDQFRQLETAISEKV